MNVVILPAMTDGSDTWSTTNKRKASTQKHGKIDAWHVKERFEAKRMDKRKAGGEDIIKK